MGHISPSRRVVIAFAILSGSALRSESEQKDFWFFKKVFLIISALGAMTSKFYPQKCVFWGGKRAFSGDFHPILDVFWTQIGHFRAKKAVKITFWDSNYNNPGVILLWDNISKKVVKIFGK